MTPYPKYPYVKGMALEDYFAGLDRYEAEVAAWVHAAPPCIGFRFDNGILRIVTSESVVDNAGEKNSASPFDGRGGGQRIFSFGTPLRVSEDERRLSRREGVVNGQFERNRIRSYFGVADSLGRGGGNACEEG